MKRIAALAATLAMLIFGFSGCIQQGAPKSGTPPGNIVEENLAQSDIPKYADGIYRGFFKEGSEEEMAVQFELSDGKFTEVTYRTIRYKDGNYLSNSATEIQRQILQQYQQAADFLAGREPAALAELAQSRSMVQDMDAVTSATLNLDKFVQAMRDGLERNVFKPSGSKTVILTARYPDGIYRGSYDDGGVEQIAVEIELKDNRFASVTYSSLNYGDRNYLDPNASGVTEAIAEQYREAASFLEDRELPALAELYEPAGLISDRDAMTGPTLRTNKLISAINSALAQGPCSSQ